MQGILVVYYFQKRILFGIHDNFRSAQEEMFSFGYAGVKLREFDIMLMPFIIHDDRMIIMN